MFLYHLSRQHFLYCIIKFIFIAASPFPSAFVYLFFLFLSFSLIRYPIPFLYSFLLPLPLRFTTAFPFYSFLLPGSLTIVSGANLDLLDPPDSIIAFELAVYHGLFMFCPVPTTLRARVVFIPSSKARIVRKVRV
jgi:hypothetical protein